MTLISSAVALLLTLRMNLSLLRLQESRLAWGRLVLHARETAGLAATYCAAAPAEAICRHLAVLGWCLKASLRAGEDDSDVVSTMLPPATAETVLAARKRPVALLRGAHAVVAEEVAAGRLDAQAHLSRASLTRVETGPLRSLEQPKIHRRKSGLRGCWQVPCRRRSLDTRRACCCPGCVRPPRTVASMASASPSRRRRRSRRSGRPLGLDRGGGRSTSVYPTRRRPFAVDGSNVGGIDQIVRAAALRSRPLLRALGVRDCDEICVH